MVSRIRPVFVAGLVVAGNVVVVSLSSSHGVGGLVLRMAALAVTLHVIAGGTDRGRKLRKRSTPWPVGDYEVELVAVGGGKVPVVQEVAAVAGLGLRAAKGLVDNAPNVLMRRVDRASAEEIAERLRGRGAVVRIGQEA